MDESNKSYNDLKTSQREFRKAKSTRGGVYAGHAGPQNHVVIGLFILMIGVLLLLSNLGIFYIGNPWHLWPVILIAVGLAHISRISGVIIAGIGAIFLARNLGWFPWDVWHLLWPFLLICVGVVMVFRGCNVSRSDKSDTFTNDTFTISDNVLKEEVVFGGITRKIQTQDFQGGIASAVFGGVEIDLRGAAIQKDEIHLEANAVFGGIELIVPDTWNVIMRGTGVLGGYEDKTHPSPEISGVKRPRLIIRGSAVFGGVSVRS
jgi:predicted membrane protein